MSINSIVSKHLKTYGEAFNVKRTMGPTKARKINRTIIGECLSLVAPEVIAARAENVRLRTKLRATYMVATGEGVTTKQVADQSAKETKKSFGSRVRKIIEAIKKFFVQIFRFFDNNKKKMQRVLTGMRAKMQAISKLDTFPTIKVPDLDTIKTPLDSIARGGENTALRNAKSAKQDTKGISKTKTTEIKSVSELEKYYKAVSKTKTTEIKSVSELEKYYKAVTSYVGRYTKAEDKVKAQKKTFEENLKKVKGAKGTDSYSKDNEKYHQERLKTLGIILGNFQVGYGALYKALGAINKVNTGSKKKANNAKATKGTATAKTAKSASAKTATAVVVED